MRVVKTHRQMPATKKVCLIAHDNCKIDMLEWASWNRELLAQHRLFATRATGALLTNELDLPVLRFRSGPLGGDQQVGAAIAEGAIDFLIFFWDPLQPHSHDVDVKALMRIATAYNIPVACNRASADFMITSPLMSGVYGHSAIDHEILGAEHETKGEEPYIGSPEPSLPRSAPLNRCFEPE